MPTVPPEWELRPASLEDRIATSLRIKAMFAPAPVLVPYEEWSEEIDAFCNDQGLFLAGPVDVSRVVSPNGFGGRVEGSLSLMPLRGEYHTPLRSVSFIIASQESFYRDRYQDPAFTIDRTKLTLTRERLEAWKDALARGEADYPLVVVPPRNLKPEEKRDPALGGKPRTLHRVLYDRLIREKGIKVSERTDPDLNTFLDQVRDLTLEDLTRTDLLGPDGKPLRFERNQELMDRDPSQPWLPYLQALYPTLPRPSVTTAIPTIGFVKWEGDPPTDRKIPNTGTVSPGFTSIVTGEETIGHKSQIDAVRLRYPLATLPQYLALFAQYRAKTGTSLDKCTWSWLFGLIDPTRFPDEPSVGAHLFLNEQLVLNRNHPANTGAVRSSR